MFFVFQQMKRKLDDVSRKLEVLYDRLRENRVSILRVQLYLNPCFKGISLNCIFKTLFSKTPLPLKLILQWLLVSKHME